MMPTASTGADGRLARDPWRRLELGALLLSLILASGTIGFVLLGLSPLDAVYMTVITVSTVGYRELGDVTTGYKAFTTVLVLAGVGTVFYTLGVLLETLIEGRLTDHLGRRRMQRRIDETSGHVIIAGWGRVGRIIAERVTGLGGSVVVIELDLERLPGIPYPYVAGDATDDGVLRAAGIDRANTLITALDTDADNLYATLSARSLNDRLFIVARARVEGAEAKLQQAGANRVVNPQHIGGARMAAMALQPHVAEFLDVVMHDGSLEFRLEEVDVEPGSFLEGIDMRKAHIRDRTGALILALRDVEGSFITNPTPETVLSQGQVLIAIGTAEQLSSLQRIAHSR